MSKQLQGADSGPRTLTPNETEWVEYALQNIGDSLLVLQEQFRETGLLSNNQLNLLDRVLRASENGNRRKTDARNVEGTI